MVISPNSSYDWLIEKIDNEIQNAKDGFESEFGLNVMRL